MLVVSKLEFISAVSALLDIVSSHGVRVTLSTVSVAAL